MAIQMISDLPVFQITKDTPRHNILGSYMEISYLQTDANSGDSHTSYKSMAIPIGTLYKAMTSSSDSSEGGIYHFPGQCVMTDGLEISGDISVNVGASTILKNLEMKMLSIKLSSFSNDISTRNHTLNTESFQVKDPYQEAAAVNYANNTVNFGAKVKFSGEVTCKTPTETSNETVVNIDILNSQLEKQTGSIGLMFETRQLDYSDDKLSSSGWIRLNSDSWYLSSDFPKTYDHLVEDYGDESKDQSDTYGSYQVSYKRAKDGHKIIRLDPSDQNSATTQETIRTNVLNQTGCFWYYTIDTSDKKFKLPIASVFFQMNGKSNTPMVGNFMKPSLPMPPSHQHTTPIPNMQDSQGKYQKDDGGDTLKVPSGTENKNTTTDVTWNADGSVYTTESNAVQPPAVLVETYMRCM